MNVLPVPALASSTVVPVGQRAEEVEGRRHRARLIARPFEHRLPEPHRQGAEAGGLAVVLLAGRRGVAEQHRRAERAAPQTRDVGGVVVLAGNLFDGPLDAASLRTATSLGRGRRSRPRRGRS